MNLVYWAGIFAAILLIPTFAMTAWRLLLGPSSADRAIATDLLGLVGIGIAAVTAALSGYSAFMDIAVGIALFGFLGAVAFAGLLERARVPKPEPRERHHESHKRPTALPSGAAKP